MYHKLKMCQYISKLGLKFVRTIPNESTSSHHAGWSMVWLGQFEMACVAATDYLVTSINLCFL